VNLPIELSFYLLLPLIAGLATWNRKYLLRLLSLFTTAPGGGWALILLGRLKLFPLS